MYISRNELRIEEGNEDEFMTMSRALHTAMRSQQGFRWAMLLRSLDDSRTLASIAMWQTSALARAFVESEAAHAAAGVAHDEMSPLAGARDYDVATARGSMTPAAFAGIVDWDVEAGGKTGFVGRWNAAFHAIEYKAGSRLLAELDKPSLFAGLHVVQDRAHLDTETLSGKVKDHEEVGLEPRAISRYEVVLLTEAD